MMVFACIFMSLLMIADGFTVQGPSGPLVAPLGSSVVLPCYVDEVLVMEDLEVEWRRTDSEALVHLFLDGESRPESQQQDYHDRAHFFTDQIQHGNFSLRLDNLTAGDEGRYTCTVHSQQESGTILVRLKHERLLVSGSDQSMSAYDGEDVTLNCSVDSHIALEDIEVSWIRTNGDVPVLLFQNNETLPEAADEQYRDRAEFFTAEISKGNFSLRLKSVRTEDKGVYMCQVFAGELSANVTVVLEQLGFSSWHIAVLCLCFAAGCGAVLLLFSLIYCRSHNTVYTSNKICNLHLSLVFYPNICMFVAFILWGFTEGSLRETITCCALYIVRPIMLIWAMPYLKYLQDNLKTLIKFFTVSRELAVFTIVFYSVLFTYVWRKTAHHTSIGLRLLSGICFGVVVLSCLILSSGRGRKKNTLLSFCIGLLSFFQLFQWAYSFVLPSQGILFVGLFQSQLLIFIPYLPHLQARVKFLRHGWITLLWIITITLLDIILLTYILLAILERETEYLGWICVILFLEVLKILVFFKENVQVQRRERQTETSQHGSALHLWNEIMYMFGAVGLVLLISVTLTAELILKARNGERVFKDLAVIVFPSECVFTLYWLLLQMHAYWTIVTTSFTHNMRSSSQRQHPRNTSENHEMENLSAPDPDVSQTLK